MDNPRGDKSSKGSGIERGSSGVTVLRRNSLAVVVAVTVTGCTTEVGTANDEPVVIEMAPGQGDWVAPGTVVRVGMVQFVVPGAGNSVAAEGITEDGVAHFAMLQVDRDGYVTASAEQAPPPSGNLPLTCSSPPECSDNGYALAPWTWAGRTYRWYFNSASVPYPLDPSTTQNMIVISANHWTFGDNFCGDYTHTSRQPSHQYQGGTLRGPNISANGTCGASDGVSVIGFGTLNGYLAYSCNWWDANGNATEGDIRLSSTTSFYSSKLSPNGCTSSFGIEQVVTHELGHTFGFAHVDDCTHADLTMSPYMGPCSRANGSLGKGDMTALKLKYH